MIENYGDNAWGGSRINEDVDTARRARFWQQVKRRKLPVVEGDRRVSCKRFGARLRRSVCVERYRQSAARLSFNGAAQGEGAHYQACAGCPQGAERAGR